MKNKIAILKNRKNKGSKKWNPDYINKRFKIDATEEIYPLFIADMDYRHSETIIQGLQELIERDDFGYFDISNAYLESIVNWHQKVHNHTLKKEWIIPANGTIAGLHIAAAALMDKVKILVLTPVYGGFKALTEEFGNRITFPLDDHHNNYELDIYKFEETIKKQEIETLLFCNPHNPSGKVWEKEELELIVNICKKHSVTILSDEIHADLLREDKIFTSMIYFQDTYDQIVISTSANKTFNISGLGASYLITSNQELKENIQKTMAKFHIEINRFGMEATRIVYEEGFDWYKAVLTEINQNLELVKNTLQSLDLQIMIPEAGYLIWIKLPNIKNIDNYVLELAKDTGVLLETGSRFIANYDGFIRLNVATDKNLLQEAMEKFKEHYLHYQEKTQ